MKRLQPIGALLALLLFLTGCAAEPVPTEAQQQPPVAAPAETPEPVEEPPAESDEEPEIMEPEIVEPEPEPLEPGFHEEGGGLYYVQEDGTLLTDGSLGYLDFDSEGRYTTGNADLDAGIQALLAAACPDPTADRETRLREAYVYIRENFRYLSMPHYEAGSTDWAETAATAMLDQGKGNCYCFTALFTYCARQLGYQAYNVAGHEYSRDNDHAWTMIDWPDGETYLFDVQLEYAYLYQYENRPVIDMFKASGSDGIYNGFVYFFP